MTVSSRVCSAHRVRNRFRTVFKINPSGRPRENSCTHTCTQNIVAVKGAPQRTIMSNDKRPALALSCSSSSSSEREFHLGTFRKCLSAFPHRSYSAWLQRRRQSRHVAVKQVQAVVKSEIKKDRRVVMIGRKSLRDKAQKMFEYVEQPSCY